MAEKQLTDSAWKVFAKGKGYKDAALLKALEVLGKVAKGSAEVSLAALAEVGKQAGVLRGANKADKDLAAYLDDLDKAVVRERKLAEQAARQQEQAASAGDDDEEESSTLLTTKMIPLLRQVRNGEVMQVLIAISGNDVALLISRRAIAAARRKLLTDRLGTTGGVKYIAGVCIFEEDAHTFVVQAQAAGLAKKLKAALLAQTDQRLKVRVRGDDPNDIDDDGEPAEGEAPADPAAAAAAIVAATTRLKGLMPRLQAAIVGGHAQAAELKLRASAATALIKQGDAGGADAALDALEALLSEPAQTSQAKGSAAAATAAAASATTTAPTQRYANHAKARLAWQATRGRVAADLAKLEQAILAHYREAPDLGELVAKVRKLDDILGALDETLIDKLDEALNAADVAQRARLHDEARTIVARYGAFVSSDELVRSLDGNPFVPLSTHDTLVKSLQVLDRSLA